MGFNKNLPTQPDGEVLENEYFFASCVLRGSPEQLAEDIACIMRAQNMLRVTARKAYLAPISWKPSEDEVLLEIAGLAEWELRDEWRPDEQRFGTQRKPTTGVAKAFLERLFGVEVEVRPLYEGLEHIDDMRIIEAVKNAYWDKGRFGATQAYPTVDDILSAGHQESSLLGSQGTYASTSPYFDVVARTLEPAAEFNRAAYSAACRNLFEAAGVLLSPRVVFKLRDGRWEIRAAGSCYEVLQTRYAWSEKSRESKMERTLIPATVAVSDPIAHYLDASIESVRVFKTTAAHYDDVVASQQMADEIGMLGLPEPEDFIIKPRKEVLADDKARAKGEGSTLLEPELTGEEELDALVGLEETKRQIREMVTYAAACKKSGRKMPRLHICMRGNPGTGKTTIARIIGHMLYDVGVLPKRNVFVETEGARFDPSADIANARRGVCYIDEAYGMRGFPSNIAVLVKAMEDCFQNYDRDGFVCIMSGYTHDMDSLISINPGMRDRIGFYIDFEDYTVEELVEIFNRKVASSGLSLDTDAQELIEKRLTQVENLKDANFANARLVEKILDRIMMRQATMHGSSTTIKKDVIVDVFEDEFADLVGEQRRTEKAKVDTRSGDEQLDDLIGLDEAKRQLREFLDFAAVQKQRCGNLPRPHVLLYGNPGTGKTTLARIYGRMAFDRGLIPRRDRFVEGDRGNLVGQFVGTTALKTKALINSARHGVLFIDEAYALKEGPNDSFGQEAIDTLVKAMEDCLDNFEKEGFVCIMAGYPDLMDEMISSNPGLRDRFGLKIEIPDYTFEELMQAMDSCAKRNNYRFAKNARTMLKMQLECIVQHKDEDFANIRLVEKIFERMMIRQSSMHGTNSVIKCDVVESVFADADIAKLLTGGTSSLGFQVA